MSNVSEKLDEIEARIMSGLKDFQRATVERIDALYKSGVKRVLVSDEVGLGKTLIARGTIAKFARLRKAQGDDLVKVVYVCSNAAIAEQNLSKLKITQELRTENMASSRLSMQHLNIFLQESDEAVKNSYIQLIPLTPDTSFRMTTGGGTVNERALMFAILRRLPELERYLPQLETLLCYGAEKAWRRWCKDYYENEVLKCDKVSSGKYLKFMTEGISHALAEKQPNGMSCFNELATVCETIRNGERYDRKIYGKLRVLFAKLSLERLEPDLVIMDEFQRFKFLLTSDSNTETGMLARKFFSNKNVRMLLLSATPYKMYSTMEEIDETQVDEHYSEFLDVMNFLMADPIQEATFKEIWNNYSLRLKEFANGETAVLEAKNDAENAMYAHVCRTERIEAKGSADLIDDADVKAALVVTDSDIRSYVQIQKLLDEMAGGRVPTDYVKSCPYLLSFMRGYKLKQKIEEYFRKNPEKLGKLNRKTFFLKRKSLDAYETLPPCNARLENVMRHTFEERVKSELLLWVPPTKPYYVPEVGPYCGAKNFTKTLIFSSWEMVPRMLAGMLSYEAERRTIGRLAKAERRKIHYFGEESKRYPLPKLNFKLDGDRPTTMSLFCLIYPSFALADCYDPIDCMNRGLTLSEIEAEIKERIAERLSSYHDDPTAAEDKRWYFVAPLLLDHQIDFERVSGNAFRLVQQAIEREKVQKNSAYLAHIKELLNWTKKLSNEQIDLGLGKRPADLLDTLTDMAISSPAVCAYRAYRKFGEENSAEYAEELARIFLARMNTPEWTAVVDLSFGSKNDDAHWQNVLAYCKAGNIQAMFDEYIHLLVGGVDKSNQNVLTVIHSAFKGSMQIRTTVYNIDTFNTFQARVYGKKEKSVGLRSHFAVAFTKGDNRDEDTDRKKMMRNAFNSPFRPFVLISTSIGQEGLDFHNYCRRIVHWNLPSNPIDLEQREGRINRYECLAIRQNVAKRYGKMRFEKDIWQEMFARAEAQEHTEETSELVPYWGLTETDDMVKIERIVPMYPLSRDIFSYERLIKILSLYRLTLGQARQEELLEYILKNCDEAKQEEMKQYFINLSPYYKAHHAKKED